MYDLLVARAAASQMQFNCEQYLAVTADHDAK